MIAAVNAALRSRSPADPLAMVPATAFGGGLTRRGGENIHCHIEEVSPFEGCPWRARGRIAKRWSVRSPLTVIRADRFLSPGRTGRFAEAAFQFRPARIISRGSSP